MKVYRNSDLSETDKNKLIKRPKMDFSALFSQVRPIINEVEKSGDAAVKSFTKKFDQVEPEAVAINPDSFSTDLPGDVRTAIDTAFDNIYSFHLSQKADALEVETMAGVICRKVSRPIQRVGLYVPGGTAVLPSTAMMLAVPAMIAGCETIVMATPPDKNGNISDEIIYIAQKAGVKTIVSAGGAQAIAAMAFGTETIPKVDKIFGPGNQYVTAAKMILQNSEAQISIDMPAGPSELLVIADKTANPAYVAADLLSQAEHGSDSQVVLAATAGFDLEALNSELTIQLEDLPRKDVASKALDNSFTIVFGSLREAFGFSNLYAPEHLIVNTEDAESWQDEIINAGSVFLGPFTPESVGDYASGTNHTLPTYGYARMYSGVNLDSFQKSITMQRLTGNGLKNLGPTVEILAEREGLQAHKNAVSIRLKDL